MSVDAVQRRLAAILITDMVGYSRLMGQDEAGTLASLKSLRESVIDRTIGANHGRIVKLMGDATLAEFASADAAVSCAFELQSELAKRKNEPGSGRPMEFRVSVNLGDVISDGDDIYGDGVNVAARLEGLADPGGVSVSAAVYDILGSALKDRFEFAGEKWVKNIDRPIRVYRTILPGGVLDRSSALRAIPTCAALRAGRPTLAVKPFECAPGDRDLREFADSLTNGIVTALTRAPGLTLIGDETREYSYSRGLAAEDLARRFEVGHVLTGAVRKLGEHLRVNASLIEAVTGRHVWAEHFDRKPGDLGDLFDLQDAIIGEIMTALDVKLLSGEAGRLVRNAFHRAEALESFHRGEEKLWLATSRPEMQEVLRLFEEAIRLEPDVSVGYAGAALAHWIAAIAGMSDSPTVSLDNAMSSARQALERDDVTGYPHWVMAHVHLNRREYDLAMAAADRAVLARPSCPTAYSLKASALCYLGKAAEAIDLAEYAMRLTPVAPPFYPAVLASAYYACGRHEEAVSAARAASAIDDHHVEPHLMLAASLAAMGRLGPAREAAQAVLKIKPQFSLEAFAAGQPFRDPSGLDRLLEHLRASGLE